jgi:tryptophan synthase alpha chain
MKRLFDNQKVLVSFITAGDPNTKATLKFLHALEKSSDIIELGIPFSDPIADGPTIQKANYRALKNGIKLADNFHIVKEFKENSETPIILMTYYNPIYVNGESNFIKTARKAGVDGLIVVDLPIKESNNYIKICRNNNIDTIFLAAPNTPSTRLKEIDKASSGFIYLVSRYGTTGERKEIFQGSIHFLKRALSLCTKPIVVGFGISKKHHVKKLVRNGANGVVIGSTLINIIEKYGDSKKTIDMLEAKTAELKKGLV